MFARVYYHSLLGYFTMFLQCVHGFVNYLNRISFHVQEDLIPHAPVLLLFTTSAQTHIFPEIRIDAVKFLDLFLEHIPQVVVEGWTQSGLGHGRRVLEGYLGILNAGTTFGEGGGQHSGQLAGALFSLLTAIVRHWFHSSNVYRQCCIVTNSTCLLFCTRVAEFLLRIPQYSQSFSSLNHSTHSFSMRWPHPEHLHHRAGRRRLLHGTSLHHSPPSNRSRLSNLSCIQRSRHLPATHRAHIYASSGPRKSHTTKISRPSWGISS